MIYDYQNCIDFAVEQAVEKALKKAAKENLAKGRAEGEAKEIAELQFFHYLNDLIIDRAQKSFLLRLFLCRYI